MRLLIEIYRKAARELSAFAQWWRHITLPVSNIQLNPTASAIEALFYHPARTGPSGC
jgi:hypothetical protein